MQPLTDLEIFAIGQSLLVATLSVVFVLPWAVLTAYSLTRFRFPGKAFIESILLFPLVMPPVVTGYLLLLLLKKESLLGGFLYSFFHIELAFTTAGAVIASSVIIFPLILRPIRVSMESVNPDLIKVSRGLGRGIIPTFFRIVLPLSYRGIIAGSVLGFARSLGEFGATIMVAGNIPFRTTTIPMAVYSFFNRVDGSGPLRRLVIISLIISFGALMISEYFLRKQKDVER